MSLLSLSLAEAELEEFEAGDRVTSGIKAQAM